MIVLPGLRRFIGGVGNLFRSASFFAPLTHTLVLERGTGSPTFTRATTGTVSDNEGILRTAIAGQARFVGARGVRNLTTTDSEGVTVRATVTCSSTAGIADAPSGVATTSARLTPTGASWQWQKSSSTKPASVGVFSVYVKGEGTSVGKTVIYYVADNGGFGNITQTTVTLTSEWQRVSSVMAGIQSGSDLLHSFRFGGTLTINQDTFLVTAWQLEDITGRTDQTTPSEYVSVGVYDNFGTTNLFSGDVADFNAAGWSRGGLTASGNTVTFGANTDQLSCPVRGVPVNSVPPVTGNTYVLQFTVSATASIASVGFEIVDVADGIPSFVKVVTVTTTPTAHSVLCVMPSTMSSSGPQFWVNRTSIMTGAAGQTMTITGLRYVDISAYHGAGVDGVKYFNTDLTGAAIPAATNLGYLAEAAATNLCLQSNSLTTAPWANQVGTCTPTQNAIGLDGATSAWTLTDNDAGVTETYGELIGGLTAVSYTASIFVAKTSGAQSSYPVIVIYDGTALRLALATVDTTNGVATIWTSYTGWTTIGTATCVSHNSNFWRVAITFTASTNAWVLNLVPAGSLTATLAGPAYNVTAQGSAVFYGAQVELGSVATSYIPTTTVAVTRNADILTYPSAGNIDGTVGWCYAEVTKSNTFSADNAILGSGANSVPALFRGGDFAMYDGTAYRTYETVGMSANATGVARQYANTWGGVATSGAINGTLGANSPRTFDGDLNITSVIEVGQYNSANHIGGTIRNVRIGQRQLSASEMSAITR